MKRSGEEGYILASAIGALLAISVVAAALVSTSSAAMARVKRAEIAAERDAVLESAFALVSAQLTMDPRRRSLDLDRDTTLEILGQSVNTRIRWESAKLDVNQASPEAVQAVLTAHQVDDEAASSIIANIRRARANGEPIRLIDGRSADRASERCIASLLTVFGGREGGEGNADRNDGAPVGRPGAGARLSIELVISGKGGSSLAAVVLMTGDPAAPVKIMDWRRMAGINGEPCDEA